METFSALLALCEGNPPVTGEFSSQRPVKQGFDLFFDVHMNKGLSKQSSRRWFETPWRSLWRHCNGKYASVAGAYYCEQFRYSLSSNLWAFRKFKLPPIPWTLLEIVISSMTDVWHIEAETRWPSLSIRHFQTHFPEWKSLNFDQKSVPIRFQLTIHQL